MDRYLTTLSPFLDDPARAYSMRELARLLRTSHTTLRNRLARLISEGLIQRKKGRVTDEYRAIESRKFRNHKIFRTLEALRESGLLERLEREYDLPIIIVYGSASQGTDDARSDLDLALITDIDKEPPEGERILRRPVSIRHYTRKEWAALRTKNRGLLTSILNGITLTGQAPAP